MHWNILYLFSYGTWRWPNEGRNMSPWKYTIFIVYKMKCCVIDWTLYFCVITIRDGKHWIWKVNREVICLFQFLSDSEKLIWNRLSVTPFTTGIPWNSALNPKINIISFLRKVVIFRILNSGPYRTADPVWLPQASYRHLVVTFGRDIVLLQCMGLYRITQKRR